MLESGSGSSEGQVGRERRKGKRLHPDTNSERQVGLTEMKPANIYKRKSTPSDQRFSQQRDLDRGCLKQNREREKGRKERASSSPSSGFFPPPALLIFLDDMGEGNL